MQQQLRPQRQGGDSLSCTTYLLYTSNTAQRQRNNNKPQQLRTGEKTDPVHDIGRRLRESETATSAASCMYAAPAYTSVCCVHLKILCWNVAAVVTGTETHTCRGRKR